MIEFTIFLLLVAIGIISIKFIFSPTIWERILALNLISGKTVLLLLLIGFHRDNFFFLDIALTFSIVGFLAVTLITRFLMEGGRQK